MGDRLETYRQTHLACSMFSERRVYKHDAGCARQESDSYEEELRAEGAAVLGGLIGMATAIRNTHMLEIERRPPEPGACKHGIVWGCIECEERCEWCGDQTCEMPTREGQRVCENCAWQHDEEQGYAASSDDASATSRAAEEGASDK